MSAAPRLLHFAISHYNEKVRWALDFKRWPHRRKALMPGFHIPQARWVSGQNQVPILELDGRVLTGSARILEEIERRRPDPPLYPAEPEARARALTLQSFFDEQVAPDVRRLFWSAYWDRPGDAARMAAHGFPAAARWTFRALFPVLRPVFAGNLGMDKARLESARQKLSRYFERIESEVGPSGYLVGDRFSVADLAVAAVMTAIIRPPEFPYPLPEPRPPALVELRERVSQRAGFQWVLGIYRRHRGVSSEIA